MSDVPLGARGETRDDAGVRVGSVALVVSGLLVAGWLVARRAEQLRPRDPPVAIDARESAREAEAIVAEAVARGWHVDRRLGVHVRALGPWAPTAPPIELEGIRDGTCIGTVASVSGMIVAGEIHFDAVALHPLEPGPHPARERVSRGAHAPPLPRAVVSATRCYVQPSEQVRHEIHVETGPLWDAVPWDDDGARPGGALTLVLLRAEHGEVGTERALDLPEGAPIDRRRRARGDRTLSGPRALRSGAIVLAAWWGIGGLLLAIGRAIGARRRRRREALAAADLRSVRRLTVVVPRAVRPDLEAVLGDRETTEHARLERVRNRLLARSSELVALGLARWRGPSRHAGAIAKRLEQDLDAIDTRAAGYRAAPGELVALTILVRHAGETLTHERTLDRAGAESAVRATVPLAPEELESLSWRWTPKERGAGLDLDGLDEAMIGLLRVDGSELVECEACGAVRPRAVAACTCADA